MLGLFQPGKVPCIKDAFIRDAENSSGSGYSFKRVVGQEKSVSSIADEYPETKSGGPNDMPLGTFVFIGDRGRKTELASLCLFPLTTRNADVQDRHERVPWK